MSNEKDDTALKVYERLCDNIKTTDDISFRLIQLVPILSGTGVSIITILEKQNILGLAATVLISMFAAVITFGIFRWELRNIQTCSWLIKRAADLEQSQFKLGAFGQEQGQFHGRNDPPPLLPLFGRRRLNADGNPIPWLDHPIGKTEAEKIIYATAIFAWIIPIIVAAAF